MFASVSHLAAGQQSIVRGIGGYSQEGGPFCETFALGSETLCGAEVLKGSETRVKKKKIAHSLPRIMSSTQPQPLINVIS